MAKEETVKEFKYGVAEVAEALDIEPASVRVSLRKKGVEKAGRSYGWNTKAELDAVVKQLRATETAAPAKVTKATPAKAAPAKVTKAKVTKATPAKAAPAKVTKAKVEDEAAAP